MRAAALAPLLALLALPPRTTRADEPRPISIAVATGATLPTPASRLGVGISVGVEAAWRPGFGRGWLELALAADAGQRTASGHGGEDTLAFAWRTVLRELWLVPELRVRVPLGAGLSASAGAGPALVLVETLGGGSIGDDPFADGRESSTVLGGRAALGGEWAHAGGALVLDVSYGFARVSHRATGADARIDGIGVRLGYRFAF